MIQDWMFYVVAGLLIITVMYLCGSRRRIDELEYTVTYLRDSYNRLFDDTTKLNKSVDILNQKMEENQGTMHSCSSSMSMKIGDVEKKLEDISNKINDHSVKIESLISDENAVEENEFTYEPSSENEIIGYRWIFPSKEEHTPSRGVYYNVVGLIKGREQTKDKSPAVCTDEAIWDGYRFVTISGDKFEKVYAYIQIPQSSDIMKTILSITLHDKEG